MLLSFYRLLRAFGNANQEKITQELSEDNPTVTKIAAINKNV